MDANWVCRDYQEGDEAAILGLFELAFGKRMRPQFWRWRYVDNPFGKGIIKLLWDGSQLIGHYAVIPMVTYLQHRIVDCVFSMTTMTHPQYGRRGIFTYLAEQTYEEAYRRGYEFVYGFPNRNSIDGFVERLGWVNLGGPEEWHKELGEGTGPPPDSEIGVVGLDRFDQRIDALWERVRGRYGVMVPRTQTFLNWRFVQNPDVDYAIFSTVDALGEVQGYMVLKVYQGPTGRKGHIVDILGMDLPEGIEKMIRWAVYYFARLGVPIITCWVPSQTLVAQTLRSYGFTPRPVDTFFGNRTFGPKASSLAFIKNRDKWYLTMADSDVF